jgi:hypothetical protein
LELCEARRQALDARLELLAHAAGDRVRAHVAHHVGEAAGDDVVAVAVLERDGTVDVETERRPVASTAR